MKSKNLTKKQTAIKNHELDRIAVEEVVLGNTKSFDFLFERYFPIIKQRYKRKLRFDDELANDLTMEVLTKIFNLIKSNRFKEQGLTVDAWFSKIIDNFLIDYFRTSKKETRISLDRGVQNVEGGFLTNKDGDKINIHLVSDSENWINQKIREDNKVEVIRAILSIKSKTRQELIKMFYFEEMSIKEIVNKKGMSEVSIKTAIFRAKEDIKMYFDGTDRKEVVAKNILRKTKKESTQNLSFELRSVEELEKEYNLV